MKFAYSLLVNCKSIGTGDEYLLLPRIDTGLHSIRWFLHNAEYNYYATAQQLGLMLLGATLENLPNKRIFKKKPFLNRTAANN